jgi:hypothetical protein
LDINHYRSLIRELAYRHLHTRQTFRRAFLFDLSSGVFCHQFSEAGSPALLVFFLTYSGCLLEPSAHIARGRLRVMTAADVSQTMARHARGWPTNSNGVHVGDAYRRNA